MALSISITRLYSSLDYKINPTGPNTYDNLRGHNMEDTLVVLDAGVPVYTCKAQTVANMEGLGPEYAFINTVTAGDFFIRAYVPQRSFYGDIHGIVGAKTLKGELIDFNSITGTNPYRWLVHDTQKKREYPDGSKFPPGVVVRSAWSDGCFIMAPTALSQISAIFKKAGVKKDQLISCSLKMEGN